MYDVSALVSRASQMGASDLHLVRGRPPLFRVHGQLCPGDDPPLSGDDCDSLALQLAGEGAYALPDQGELDLAASIEGRRLRVHLFRQQGATSAALRLLASDIPALASLGLPPVAETFSHYPSGLVLVTGETGSGKSTTLAALLDEINHTRPCHIVTLEDPVEYIYSPDKALINQREIGRDTRSFPTALRAVLREDPDVILIGEMRDPETIEAAITAAETGHLVFATLHTNSAAGAIDRVVDVFPAERQRQIRLQLSMTLRAVLSQRLLPRSDKTGRVLACEVMVVTNAISNLIREGKTPQIQSAIATSASQGNVTMDTAMARLVRSRLLDEATALRCATDPDTFRRALR